MYLAKFRIHGVGIDFVSNSKRIFHAVKSELGHVVELRPQLRKDKVLYFWNGSGTVVPRPLKKLMRNSQAEKVTSKIRTVVDHGKLQMGILAKEHFNQDEGLLVCLSLINFLVRFTLFRRIRAVGFHAAACSWRNRGLLLPGASGAGKTTLSYFLAKAGFKHLSDEDSLLHNSSRGAEILGLQRRLRLEELFFNSKEGQFLVNKYKMPQYRAFGEQGLCFDLRKLKPTAYQRRAQLKSICILENEQIETPELSLLDGDQALASLLESFEAVAIDSNSNEPAQRIVTRYNASGFQFVNDLIANYPVYHLRYDIEKHDRLIPRMMKEILD
ncbi:MAG: hypothetical protein ACE5HO_02995 [bacterium]